MNQKEKNTINMKNNGFMSFIILAVIGLIVIVGLSSSIFYTIDPGEAAVKFKRFGNGIVKDKIYKSGFHVIAPWDKLIRYDVREQLREEKMTVLSENGLDIEVDMSIRYRPEMDKLGYLHDQIGKNYADKIVNDVLRAAVRNIFGRYTPEEIYSTKREQAQTEIQQEVELKLKDKYIIMESALIRGVNLPERIEAAIADKLEAEQKKEKYEFLLISEKQEAERVRIEAEGKAEANRVLNASLTNNILRDKGIEATLKLAESGNSKIVVIGGGDEGLPLILGNQ